MKKKIILLSTLSALLFSGIASAKVQASKGKLTPRGMVIEDNYKDRTPWYKRTLGQKPYQNYFYNKTKYPITLSNNYHRNVVVLPGKKGVVWGDTKRTTRHRVLLEKTGYAQEGIARPTQIKIDRYISTNPKARVDVTYSSGELTLTPREQ